MPTISAVLPTNEHDDYARREITAIVDPAVRALVEADVEVPEPVVTTLEHLSRTITALNSSVDPQGARSALAHHIATGHTPTQKDYQAVTIATEARTTLAAAVVTGYELAHQVLREHRDTIIQGLAATMANPAFDALAELAHKVTARDTAATLLRSNRDSDARALANAAAHLEAIRRAVAVRQTLHRKGRLDADVFGSAGLWNYDPHANHDTRRSLPMDGSSLEDWLATIREGTHVPWFPTYREAQAYDVEVRGIHEGEAQAAEQRRRESMRTIRAAS